MPSGSLELESKTTPPPGEGLAGEKPKFATGAALLAAPTVIVFTSVSVAPSSSLTSTPTS